MKGFYLTWALVATCTASTLFASSKKSKLLTLEIEKSVATYDPTDNFAPLLITVQKQIEASNHSDLSFFHPLSTRELRRTVPIRRYVHQDYNLFEEADFFVPFGGAIPLNSFFSLVSENKFSISSMPTELKNVYHAPEYNSYSSSIAGRYEKFMRIKAMRDKNVWDSMGGDNL